MDIDELLVNGILSFILYFNARLTYTMCNSAESIGPLLKLMLGV